MKWGCDEKDVDHSGKGNQELHFKYESELQKRNIPVLGI